MPRIERLTYEALAGGSPDTDAGTRVYPWIVGQDVPLPRIVYTRVSTAPVTSLSGSSGLDNVRMQVDCYAATMPGALRLASQVRTLLEGGGAGFTALLAGQFDAYEPETKVFRQSLDFSCWEHL